MRIGIVVVVLFGLVGAQVAYGQPTSQEPAPPAQPSEPPAAGPPVVAPPAQPEPPPTGVPAPTAPAQPPANYPPPPGYYPPPPPPPMSVQQPVPVQRQRAGLFFAGDLALAGHASGRNGGTISGGGLNLRLAIGFMAMPRLVLFAGASYFESSSVTIEQGGMSFDTDDFTISATSLFLGGRIYTPSDFYFEGTLGTLNQKGKDEVTGIGGTSDTGVIGHLGFGKEWLLLSGLTIGAGGRVGIGSVPAQDGGDDPTVVHLDLCISLGYSGG